MHFADVMQLLDTFDALAQRRSLDDHRRPQPSAHASQPDYLIDIGPGAGVHGGNVVVAGTPEEVAACARV
ncbi:MAG: hypothetical protein R3B96_25145 [Pirellulaceae bacterium]